MPYFFVFAGAAEVGCKKSNIAVSYRLNSNEMLELSCWVAGLGIATNSCKKKRHVVTIKELKISASTVTGVRSLSKTRK